MAKRYERRKAAAQALGIELDGKPMHELRELLQADAGATERYAEIVGITPRPEPEPEPAPAAKPATTPAPATRPRKAAKSGKTVIADPGDALKAALAKANGPVPAELAEVVADIAA